MNMKEKITETKTYRKTGTVDAFQWNGERPLPYPLVNNWDNNPMTPSKVSIQTLEGWLNVKEGSYICRGINGEYWAVDKDIFERTYEQLYVKDECISTGDNEELNIGFNPKSRKKMKARVTKRTKMNAKTRSKTPPKFGVSAEKELDIKAGYQSMVEDWQRHNRDNGLSWNQVSELCNEISEYVQKHSAQQYAEEATKLTGSKYFDQILSESSEESKKKVNDSADTMERLAKERNETPPKHGVSAEEWFKENYPKTVKKYGTGHRIDYDLVMMLMEQYAQQTKEAEWVSVGNRYPYKSGDYFVKTQDAMGKGRQVLFWAGEKTHSWRFVIHWLKEQPAKTNKT